MGLLKHVLKSIGGLYLSQALPFLSRLPSFPHYTAHSLPSLRFLEFLFHHQFSYGGPIRLTVPHHLLSNLTELISDHLNKIENLGHLSLDPPFPFISHPFSSPNCQLIPSHVHHCSSVLADFSAESG